MYSPVSVVVLCTLIASIYSWTEVQSFNGGQTSQNVGTLAFSNDDTLLFTAGTNGRLKVIFLEDYSIIQNIRVGTGQEFITKILIHPTSDEIYLSTSTGRLIIYFANYTVRS